MGNKNQRAREKLIQIFGNIDMIDEAHIRSGNGRYTGHIEELTYHHIKPQSKGGKATVQNGALLCEENHQWLHSQRPVRQKEINRAIQRYKECQIKFCDEVATNYKVVCTELNIQERKKEKSKGEGR